MPFDAWSWLVQIGHRIPGSAWELSARYDAYTFDPHGPGTFGASELGFAVNYYVDGHGDKLTLDVSFIDGGTEDGNLLADVYAGYNGTGRSDAVLLRFQWQMAL